MGIILHEDIILLISLPYQVDFTKKQTKIDTWQPAIPIYSINVLRSIDRNPLNNSVTRA